MTIQELAKQKYKEYKERVPELRRKQIETYTLLIFTFLALAIFLVFAINPTVGTIIGLRKQLQDEKQVKSALDTKLQALTVLGESYTALTPQLPFAFLAVPRAPDAPLLFGQLQGLARNTNVTITSLRTAPAPLTMPVSHITTLTMAITVSGSYANIMQFLTRSEEISRVMSFSDMAFSKTDVSGSVVLTMKGEAYFKP